MNHYLYSYNRLGMINKTSSTLLVLDEEDPRGTNWGTWIVGNNSRWVDWPANNHGKRTPLSFIDGHVEMYDFLDDNTTQITWFWSTAGYTDRMNFRRLANPNQ